MKDMQTNLPWSIASMGGKTGRTNPWQLGTNNSKNGKSRIFHGKIIRFAFSSSWWLVVLLVSIEKRTPQRDWPDRHFPITMLPLTLLISGIWITRNLLFNNNNYILCLMEGKADTRITMYGSHNYTNKLLWIPIISISPLLFNIIKSWFQNTLLFFQCLDWLAISIIRMLFIRFQIAG